MRSKKIVKLPITAPPAMITDEQHDDDISRLYAMVNQLVFCRLRAEYLDELHIPRGSVFACTNKKMYRHKGDRRVSTYSYTNLYIYTRDDRRKHYISRELRAIRAMDFSALLGKHVEEARRMALDAANAAVAARTMARARTASSAGIEAAAEAGTAAEAAAEADPAVILLRWIMTRVQYGAVNRRIYRSTRLAAQRLCDDLRTRRMPGPLCLDFDRLMEEQERLIRKSPAFYRIRAELDGLLYVDPDGERPMYPDDVYVKLDRDELYHSKNELITALCLKECGISYSIEPRYPFVTARGTNRFADFLLHLPDGSVYLEVAGLMDDAEYRDRLTNKLRLAKAENIPLLVLDMTQYAATDAGSYASRVSVCYSALKRILLQLRAGRLAGRGQILRVC